MTKVIGEKRREREVEGDKEVRNKKKERGKH